MIANKDLKMPTPIPLIDRTRAVLYPGAARLKVFPSLSKARDYIASLRPDSAARCQIFQRALDIGPPPPAWGGAWRCPTWLRIDGLAWRARHNHPAYGGDV